MSLSIRVCDLEYVSFNYYTIYEYNDNLKFWLMVESIPREHSYSCGVK